MNTSNTSRSPPALLACWIKSAPPTPKAEIYSPNLVACSTVENMSRAGLPSPRSSIGASLLGVELI